MVRIAYPARSAQPCRARYSLYPIPAVQTISSMSLSLFLPLHAPLAHVGGGGGRGTLDRAKALSYVMPPLRGWASNNNLSSVISVTGVRGGVRYYYDIFVFSINALLYSKPLIQLT